MKKEYIAVGALVVLILVAVGYILYSTVLQKKLLNTSPTQTATERSFTTEDATTPDNQVLVEADPEFTSYKVELTNSNFIEQKLFEYGFWNQNGVTLFDPLSKEVRGPGSVQQATFFLIGADKKLSYTAFKIDEESSFSPWFNPTGGVMTVYVYIAQPTSQKLSDAVLSIASFLTHADQGFKLIQSPQAFVAVTPK